MSGIEVKNHRNPDETVAFDRGMVELMTVGLLTIGHEVLEPGWRWSIHVKPIVQTERCEFHHLAYVLSGRMGVETRDGEVRELIAGDVYDVAPGHDAWIIGDEPFVEIDFQGIAGWAKPPQPGDRVLTTMLFTDIVASTALAHEVGDRRWKHLLSSHREDVRSLLEMHRGREIDTAGDGFFATFDSPAQAIQCALKICDAAHKLGIETRAGVHTGEAEVADGDIRGLAVHVAARVMAAAGAGEVFVSSTSRELTSGADLEFVDRGSHDLKGVEGSRQLYQAQLRSEARP